jgi:hypothetical protein
MTRALSRFAGPRSLSPQRAEKQAKTGEIALNQRPDHATAWFAADAETALAKTTTAPVPALMTADDSTAISPARMPNAVTLAGIGPGSTAAGHLAWCTLNRSDSVHQRGGPPA